MMYAGIGPRDTPMEIQAQMSHVGLQLEKLGFILSSGDGLGADQAWAESVKPKNQRIYLADSKPNCKHGIVPVFNQAQWDFADKHFGMHRKDYKGKPLSLSSQNDYVQKLFMRNLNVLVGDVEDVEPVDFVVYWHARNFTKGWASGTGHTISMAHDPLLNIPCFNINIKDDQRAMDALIEKLIGEHKSCKTQK